VDYGGRIDFDNLTDPDCQNGEGISSGAILAEGLGGKEVESESRRKTLIRAGFG
jgi:hypothetical protein